MHLVFHVSSAQLNKFNSGGDINLSYEQLLGSQEGDEILDVNVIDVQVLRKIASSINTQKGMKFSPHFIQSGGSLFGKVLKKIGIKKAVAPVLKAAAPILNTGLKTLAGTAGLAMGNPMLGAMAGNLGSQLLNSQVSGMGLQNGGAFLSKVQQRKLRNTMKKVKSGARSAIGYANTALQNEHVRSALSNPNVRGLGNDLIRGAIDHGTNGELNDLLHETTGAGMRRGRPRQIRGGSFLPLGN